MSYSENSENTRPCPTCRSMISVMATRCKHCGEKVSRPRTEEERFTVKDLGGVSADTYRMSESVIGALEAFREEELNSPNEGDIFHTPTFGGHARDTLELDATHKAMADAVTPDQRERTRRQQLLYSQQRRSDKLRTAGLIVGGIAVAVLLIFGGVKVYNQLTHEAIIPKPPRENHALAWLNDGNHTTLEALEEAVSAVNYDSTPENLKIADTVRDQIEVEVRELLYNVPWERDDMSEASAIATRASAIDGNRRMADLRDEVQREVSAYKFSLLSIDEGEGSATFKINDPNYDGPKEQVVQEGDYLAERFLIDFIRSDQVELLDEQVKNDLGQFRQLRIRVLDPLRGM